jgi:hypothetical protein
MTGNGVRMTQAAPAVGENPVRDMKDELAVLALRALESVGELCDYLTEVAAELDAIYARRAVNGGDG